MRRGTTSGLREVRIETGLAESAFGKKITDNYKEAPWQTAPTR